MVTFTPLAPRTRRSHAVAEELGSLIRSGRLQPGDRLPTEHLLCEQFGVSRTTLREAIQMLRTRGLLEVSPGRGSFVTMPDLEVPLADLTLATGCLHSSKSELQHLLCSLLKQAIPAATAAPVAARQQLFRDILLKDQPAADNLRLELSWQRNFLQLAGQTCAPVMLALLHGLLSHERAAKLNDPEELARTIQFQLRATNALVEGDAPLLERTFTAWLSPVTPLRSVQPEAPRNAAHH